MATSYFGDYRSSASEQLESTRQIADLSDHAQALEANIDISDLLTDEQERKIVQYVKSCSEMSYAKISQRYPAWLEADRAHDVYVPPDTTEFREKAVMSDTRAIADTVLTYQMAALTGRNPMFMLEGLNRKSRNAAVVLERVLHQHMRRTAGEAKLLQMLQDGIRYGFAPTKIVWNGADNTNHIVNIDPRRCFPDPRVQWGEWDRMQFVVSTEYMSTSALLSSGMYPKMNKYPALSESRTSTRTGWNSHKNHKEVTQGLNVDPVFNPTTQDSSLFQLGSARTVDEIWFRVQGWEIGMPQAGTVYLTATILDEEVCIRFQLNPYGKQLPFVFGGLYHDSHKTYGQSLYDLLLPMHHIATYLLRSRIDNISATMTNLIFADPSRIHISDLIDRNPFGIVRTLPGTNPGEGLFISQVPDVTRGHFQDIAHMADLKQRVSAASDAQQGVPTSDVRTATEIQRLTQLGSQRLGVLSRLTSAQTIRPMVRMMVGNIQDAVSASGEIQVSQKALPANLQSITNDGYLDFNPAMLDGDIDYLVIDGSLPLEPTRDPNVWMQMIQIMNQTGLNMEFDMSQITEEAIRSMGVSDLDRFRISPEELKQNGLSPSQQMAMAQADRGATGKIQEGETIQREVERGNLVPANR